jgi:hypothetical protein
MRVALKKTHHELRLLSEKRTNAFDQAYVKEVVNIWNLAKARPNLFKDVSIRSQWKSHVDGKIIVVRSIVYEYYFTLLFWVDQLLEKNSVLLLARACVVIKWFLMPYAKLLASKTSLFLFSEDGCKQLLTISLVKLMVELVHQSEAAGAVSDNFCGMVQWVINQTTLLVHLNSPFAGKAAAIKSQMEALMLLYVKADDASHEMALALEAMRRFSLLKDNIRYEKAKSKVSATAAMPPSSQYKHVIPIGPSTIKRLQDKKIFS